MVLDKTDSIDHDARMAKKPDKRLSDQIRRAIDESGKSRYRIAQETGINESQLAKFYRGPNGLTLAKLDVLAEYLGLEVVRKQTKSKGK